MRLHVSFGKKRIIAWPSPFFRPVPQAGSQFRGRSRLFVKYPGYPGLLGWERSFETLQMTQQMYALGECPALT